MCGMKPEKGKRGEWAKHTAKRYWKEKEKKMNKKKSK